METKIIKDNSVRKKYISPSELNFAFLDRVSDPSQLKKGKTELTESLKVQTQKMKNAAERLGTKWRDDYHISGQQHATAGYERKDFDQIKKWVVAGKINALMIPETDRFGRCSLVSKEMYAFLQKHNVRFFGLEREHDLNDPDVRLHLGIKGEIDEHKVLAMLAKAYEIKLSKAMDRGVYIGGRAPFPYMRGRDDNYIVDPEKHKIWKEIRTLYKKRKNKYNTVRLASMFDISTATVSKCLFSPLFHTGKRPIHFKHSKQVLDYESVDMKVETGGFKIIGTKEEYEELIQIRDSRKIIDRNSLKHQYLLSRVIKCGHCGKWMSGQPVKDKHTGDTYLYYRCVKMREEDSNQKRGKIGCGFGVPAKPLEEAFLREFEYLCYDPEKLEQAIGKEGERFNEIQELKEILNKRLEEIRGKRQNIVDGIREAERDQELIKSLAADGKKLTIDEENINRELKELQEEEENLPDLKAIKRMIHPRIPAIIKRIKQRNGLQGYSFNDKRRLLSYFFPNQHPKNRKYGVTVKAVKEGKYSFTVEGLLNQFLFVELYITDSGWEMDGGYSKKVALDCFNIARIKRTLT